MGLSAVKKRPSCKKCRVRLTKKNKYYNYAFCKECGDDYMRDINRQYEIRHKAKRKDRHKTEQAKLRQRKYFKNYYLRVIKPRRQAVAKKRKLTKEYKK